MREVVRLEPAAVLPAGADVLRAQGVPESVTPDARVQALLDAALALALELAQPVAVLEEVPATSFAAIYHGDGRNADRTPLEEVYPKAGALWLFAGTVGEPLSAEIQRLFDDGDLPAAVMLDAAASEAAELMVAALEKRVAARWNGRFRHAVLAYSPGYCGWHVSGQRALFERLRPEEIGIRLNESCLMTPIKSVSGVLVAGGPGVHRFRCEFECCAACVTRQCVPRMASVRDVP